VPERDARLAELPAEEDELAAFRMLGGKIDEPGVEILHLDARVLELGDEPSNGRSLGFERGFGLLHQGRVDPAAVPTHLAAKARDTPLLVEEPLPRTDELLDERAHGVERPVRLLLGEEPHGW